MPVNAVQQNTALPVIPRPPFPWGGLIAGAVVLAILVWSAQPPPIGTGFSIAKVIDGLPQMQQFFGRLVPTSEKPWPNDYWMQIAPRVLETLKIAFASSFIGAALALPYALIGARNLAGGPLIYNFGRALLNLIRSVPDLVLASILVSIVGIGPFPGVIALIVFTFGIVAKLLCDAIETIDPGPLEAITAAGGNRLQQALFAVLPQVGPDFIAYSLYAFEVNIRAATFLGYVGAGGIGMILNTSIKFFQYNRVGMIVFAIFVMVLVIDIASNFLRRRLV